MHDKKKRTLPDTNSYDNNVYKYGFEVIYPNQLKFIEEGTLSDTIEQSDKSGAKIKNKIRIFSVVYEGYIRITNENEFKRSILLGIGREKAFGFGLISFLRIQPKSMQIIKK